MAIPVNGPAAGPSSSGLTAIHDAILACQFAQLADIIDNLELEIAASGSPKPQDWPYAVHVLAHVVNHDLNSARFVWKRTPEAIKESSPELVAAWKIVQNMWTHDHAGVYKALKGYDWSALVQPVAGAIGGEFLIAVRDYGIEAVEVIRYVPLLYMISSGNEDLTPNAIGKGVDNGNSTFRDDYSAGMLKLLSTAYSTVSVADASGFLGLSENEAVTFLTQQHGWVLDPASQMLTVRPMSSVANKRTDSSQLQNLTEYVFHLEH